MRYADAKDDTDDNAIMFYKKYRNRTIRKTAEMERTARRSKTTRGQTYYDSDQEGAKRKATIRQRKYAAYEKRREARRREKNHSRLIRKTAVVSRTQWSTSHNHGE